MEVKLEFHAKNMDKDELRLLTQKIREWELLTERTEIDTFLITTAPPLTSEEHVEMLKGVFPPFKHVDSVPLDGKPVLHLGSRQVVINGHLVGICEELCLSMEDALPEHVKQLEEAQVIQLIRMGRG